MTCCAVVAAANYRHRDRAALRCILRGTGGFLPLTRLFMVSRAIPFFRDVLAGLCLAPLDAPLRHLDRAHFRGRVPLMATGSLLYQTHRHALFRACCLNALSLPRLSATIACRHLCVLTPRHAHFWFAVLRKP